MDSVKSIGQPVIGAVEIDSDFGNLAPACMGLGVLLHDLFSDLAGCVPPSKRIFLVDKARLIVVSCQAKTRYYQRDRSLKERACGAW